jgi:outer membrane protein
VLRNLYANKRDYAQAVYDYIVNSLTLKHAASLLGREDIEVVNRWLTSADTDEPLTDAAAGTIAPRPDSSKTPDTARPAAERTKPRKNGPARL